MVQENAEGDIVVMIEVLLMVVQDVGIPMMVIVCHVKVLTREATLYLLGIQKDDMKIIIDVLSLLQLHHRHHSIADFGLEVAAKIVNVEVQPQIPHLGLETEHMEYVRMDCAVIIEELLRDARNVGLILMVIVLNVKMDILAWINFKLLREQEEMLRVRI